MAKGIADGYEKNFTSEGRSFMYLRSLLEENNLFEGQNTCEEMMATLDEHGISYSLACPFKERATN